MVEEGTFLSPHHAWICKRPVESGSYCLFLALLSISSLLGIGGLDLVDLVYIVAFVCLLVLLLVQIFIGPLSDTIERKKHNLGNKLPLRQNPSGTAARQVDS